MSQITHFCGNFLTSKLSSRKVYDFSHVCIYLSGLTANAPNMRKHVESTLLMCSHCLFAEICVCLGFALISSETMASMCNKAQ